MRRWTATARIAWALAMLSATVLLCLRLLGLFADDGSDRLRLRTQHCETIAVTCSQFASRRDIQGVRTALAAFVTRNPNVLSAAVRDPNGELVVAYGPHETEWQASGNSLPTRNCIYVPVISGGHAWGRVEVTFKPLLPPGFAGFLSLPSIQVTMAATVLNICAFYLCLRSCLRKLNPSKVVPERVRAALDTMVEGLVVLDDKSRIVLANQAFAETVGRSRDQLQGQPIAGLPWKSSDPQQSAQPPWQSKTKNATNSCVLELLGDAGQDPMSKTFIVNSTPIADDAGGQRGTLVSFDDITALQEKNNELTEMLRSLEVSREEIQQQNEQLQLLATRDPLTSCLNRRSFLAHLEECWKAVRRYRIPLSCIMLDVDHFKDINDQHGHSVGDEVLIRIAAALNGSVRETDYLCRYGGEEFCILLPHTTIDDACIAAERFRSLIETLEFPHIQFTASLGVASSGRGIADARQLLDQADKCLYAAKRRGRNRVVRFDQFSGDAQAAASAANQSRDDGHSATSQSLTDDGLVEFASALVEEMRQAGRHNNQDESGAKIKR